MNSKIGTSLIVFVFLLLVLVPLFVILSVDTINQYKDEPEIPEGEGFTILSEFFTYLFNYLVYFF